jgi:hypothetical protein
MTNDVLTNDERGQEEEIGLFVLYRVGAFLRSVFELRMCLTAEI